MLLHSGHITACYSRHDSDIHIIHRRLELESDHVKTVRIIHCAQRTCTRFASLPNLAELLLIGCSIASIWTPKNQIKYIDTKNQLADTLTEGNFTRDIWNHLLCLFNISHFSSTNCLEVMSKRTQEDAGEERVTAKSKPMMNLVSQCSERTPDVLASTASESPGKPDM